MASDVDKVLALVKKSFGDSYTIVFKGHSPNAQHYNLTLNETGDKFHLKVVKNSYLQHNEYSEVDLLKNLTHEHIVSLLDYGSIGIDRTYLLFPHIDGYTLDVVAKKKTGFWSAATLEQLAAEMLEALSYLGKQSIVHRDIKPKNIIYDMHNKKFLLLDLGIGYFTEDPGRDNSIVPKNSGAGSKYYSAPEQFFISSNEPYDITPLIDQFSLGSILYEYATGKHPYINDDRTASQNYNDLVTRGEVLYGDLSKSQISPNFQTAILKMLEKYPAGRFQTIDEIQQSITGSAKKTALYDAPIYIKMPHNGKDDLLDFAKTNRSMLSGVILTINDSEDRAEELSDAGVNILVDPETYRVTKEKDPFPKLAKALRLSKNTRHTYDELTSSVDTLLLSVADISSKLYSEDIILPYFSLDSPGGKSIEITKTIWKRAAAFYKSKMLGHGNLYGAMVIPYSIVSDSDSRSQLLSQLAGSYDINGMLIIFENNHSDIATCVEKSYLEGVSEVTHFFEARYSKVIVYKAGIESLAINTSAGYATGWAKSMRNFKLAKGGGSGGKPQYKMRYFAPKLFTFIEEQSMVRAINSEYNDYLKCECMYCSVSNPLDGSYDPEKNEKYERLHFFLQIVGLKEALYKAPDGKVANTVALLEESDKRGSAIKANPKLAVVTGKTIPSYKRLISLIKD